MTPPFDTVSAANTLQSGQRTFTIWSDLAGSLVHKATATASGFTSGNSAYWTTISSSAVRLQIVMPGETANPGSVKGKTGTPSTEYSNVAFTVTVNSVDPYWNISTTGGSYDTPVSLTTNDQFVSTINESLIGGTTSFVMTMKTSNTTARVTISSGATASSNDNMISTSAYFNVGASTPIGLLIVMPGETYQPGSVNGKIGQPSTLTAGNPFQLTVKAVDTNWNTVFISTYVETVNETDYYEVYASSAWLTNGTTYFVWTYETALSSITDTGHTMEAIDINPSGATLNTYTQNNINVVPNIPTQIQLVMPGETADPGSGTTTGKTGVISTPTAGVPFAVTVNGCDNWWNVTSTGSEVEVTTDDNYAVIQSSHNLIQGTTVFNVTMMKGQGVDLHQLTADYDGIMNPQTSDNFIVFSSAPAKLQILVPGETADKGSLSGKVSSITGQTAGVNYTVTVNLVDPYWNIVNSLGNSTTVQINVQAPAYASYVSSYTYLRSGTTYFTLAILSSGSWTNTVNTRVKPVGYNYYFTASTSSIIPVVSSGATQLQVILPNEVANPGSGTGKTVSGVFVSTAGIPFTVTVNAVDPNYNLAIGRSDYVSILTTDINDVVPAANNLTGSQQTFVITDKTASSVHKTTATAAGLNSGGSSYWTTIASASVQLQIVMPGETANPG